MAIGPDGLDYGRAEIGRATTNAGDIRSDGWMVAVHNDYRMSGQLHTFWLFTKGDRAVKGEGLSDAEALNVVRKQIGLSLSTQVAPAVPALLFRLRNHLRGADRSIKHLEHGRAFLTEINRLLEQMEGS